MVLSEEQSAICNSFTFLSCTSELLFYYVGRGTEAKAGTWLVQDHRASQQKN